MVKESVQPCSCTDAVQNIIQGKDPRCERTVVDLRFVDPQSQDYRMLAKKLDDYYFELVGDVHLRYAEANRPENMACLVVAYAGEYPVGCGCWKRVDEVTAEVKRIYVLPEYRRRGVASRIIRLLEKDIVQAGYRHIVLETARTTGDSKALYLAVGYHEIDYYGSPAGAENCRCFEKRIL